MKNFEIDKVLKFNMNFWKRLSILIKGWIMADMIAGKVQKYTANPNYLSRSYAKYKANFMNRFTTRVYKDGTVAQAGTKLKAYQGVSIKSNNVAKVNMMLTGQTIDGLEYKTSTPTSVTLSYKPKDENKIVGNEKLGRHITTLSEENQDKVVKQLEAELDKKIREFYKGKIKITVGGQI